MPSSKRKPPSGPPPSGPEASDSPSTSTPKAQGRDKTGTTQTRGSDGEASDLVSAGASTLPKTRRHVQPLGPRVLVRIRDVPQRLDSGLYLPATAISTLPEAVLAEVVEVARTQPKTDPLATRDEQSDEDADADEVTLGENVSGIPLGALVLFGRDHGIRVPWDDRLRLVEVRHILAIVDEIPEDALQ